MEFLIILQIVMELPVEHGLLLDNLLDLAHGPFTHTSTFAKGWVFHCTYAPCISPQITDRCIWTFISVVTRANEQHSDVVFVYNILMLSLSLPASSGLQGYWVPDTFIWAPRLLGSLRHRHGVPTTVHGLVNHRHFKAWKARREEHPAMLDASPSTPCSLAFL
jgi:hypothetical protein